MLNLFRLAGDFSHVISILLLILRLRVSQNAIGISMKTQELYLIVFIARYLDLFTTFYSLYNSAMKILYIAATGYILYMVRKTEPFKTNYETSQDSFLHWQFAVAPAAVCGIIASVYEGFDIIEVWKTYAMYLCVHRLCSWLCDTYKISLFLDVLEFFHFFGTIGYCPSVDNITEVPWSWESNWELCFFLGRISSFIHS